MPELTTPVDPALDNSTTFVDLTSTDPTPTGIVSAQTKDPKSNIRHFQNKEYDITDQRFAGCSKKQIKKILREEIWQENKPERRQKKRAAHKRKRTERLKLIEQGIIEPQPKRNKPKNMVLGHVGVILDCSFSHLMNEKEISSMQQQIGRVYTANVRAEKESMQLTLTSLDEPLKKQMDEKVPSWVMWKHFDVTTEPYLNKFRKEDLVYLTADSENVAHELEEGKTYIIGGIVDKNRHKNLCNSKAKEQGIKTAQLPIGNYIKMASRKVLTVNQVFEIMVKWHDCRDWREAFLQVIPGRKLKESTIINQDGEVEEEEESDEEDLEEDLEKNEDDQVDKAEKVDQEGERKIGKEESIYSTEN